MANKLSVEGSFTDKCFANLNLKFAIDMEVTKLQLDGN